MKKILSALLCVVMILTFVGCNSDKTCLDCDKSISNDYLFCPYCGNKQTDDNTSENASSGFKYTIYSDGKRCGIEGIGVCTDNEIIIPDKIEGCIVVTIGERAFENCTNVTSIKIPETVTSIGASAFYGCSNLKYLDLPVGITKIGNRAFQQCSSLEKIIIPDNVTSLGMCMFSGDTNLKEIQIPKQLTSIGLWAFDGCGNLEKLIIPKTVTSMDVAFLGCNKLSIYCEIEEQPEGWEYNWSCCWSHNNGTNSCTVVWGYTGD